ncbi:hypothetical protein F5Y18DRAFT_381776 [Xylariaceae sp. FL1019]|nr:hypothetical protein F5Y18DRAFT_381776 [Xylariaceae sp. FL1019]
MQFSPDPTNPWAAQDWTARLHCKCADVPQLMRTGFHYDMDNVVREEGFTALHANRWVHSPGVPYIATRFYFLKDLEEPRRWTAVIDVHAPVWETVYRFDLSCISRDQIRQAVAFNPVGFSIYRYLRGSPAECYNAIYDDMPLEGWWPWPKKEYDNEATTNGINGTHTHD